MARHDQARLLVALFVLVVALLEFPAVAVVEAIERATHLPLTFGYVFGVWALAIAGAAWILERRRS
jgi:hypothetical protein